MKVPKEYEALSDEDKAKVDAFINKEENFARNLFKGVLWTFAPLALFLAGIGLVFLGLNIGWDSVTWMGISVIGISAIWGFLKWVSPW